MKKVYPWELCSLTFKSPSCAYQGPEDSCDKTYEQCVRYGNQAHFHGYQQKTASNKVEEFAAACVEWLKGCSITQLDSGDPADCKECTDAFLKAVKRIGREV